MQIATAMSAIRLSLGLVWLAGQIYIVQYPFVPLIQRPLHLVLAIALVILWSPLASARLGKVVPFLIDATMLAGLVAITWYYMTSVDYLSTRYEGIDDPLIADIVFGVTLVVILMECVRRVVGWSLLGVIIAFLVYAFGGSFFPGWMSFSGFTVPEMVDTLTMTANGVLGVTTATSIQFVFYFVTFGAFYAAIGGSQLFIDISLSLVGRHKGGAAKAAIVSSSMMGSISGSAVANVAATGVFTIPLMKRAGLDANRAGATEAIASTGGQLMPPVMGIAAFVMAELLQYDYGRIALAGIIPAVAFYIAVFVAVDLHARRTGMGTVTDDASIAHDPIKPRLYLLAPPVILIWLLVQGNSATYSATAAIFSCVAIAVLRPSTWRHADGWVDLVKRLWSRSLEVVGNATRSAARVAVPIAAIGVIISVSIQSNLAIKFSTRLIEMSGGTLFGAMFFIIVGCIIMGMGLPTVAAYIIGAILFVPALLKLGIPELSAHFFVMYYCVLSMITPPVALASYTAAGMAEGNTMTTSLLAFRMSLVAFFIPFAFAFDESLLGNGSLTQIAAAFASLMCATAAWAVALTGYLKRSLNLAERLLMGAGSLAAIFSPTGTQLWGGGMIVILVITAWCIVRGAGADNKTAVPGD